MDYQHAQTSGTAGVIGIKTPTEVQQAERPSGGTARRERAEPAEPPLGSGPSRGRPGGPAPPARHGGGAPVPLGLGGADRAAATPAQRVLPGAGGARPPPAAALAQRRHLRRLAGGLRALRSQRGTGPAAALGPCAARARPSAPRSPCPAVAPGGSPAGWVAARVPGAALASVEGGRSPWEGAERRSGASPAPRNAELMGVWWQRERCASLGGAGCHLLAPVVSRVPLFICSS